MRHAKPTVPKEPHPNQKRQLFEVRCEVLQQKQARLVRPVKVVHEEDHGRLAARALEELEHRVE